MPTDIVSLSMEVDARQVRKADDALDDLTDSAKLAENAVEDLEQQTRKGSGASAKFAKNTKTASRAAGQVGRSAGQAGIQIQQFVGQVQAGTNATVALSQQAADLGFVLGAPLVGVVVSLAAGLGGALYAALNSSKDALRDLTDELDVFGEELDEVSGQVRALAAEQTKADIAEQAKVVDKLNAKYQKQSDRLLELRQLYRDRVDLIQSEETATGDLARDLSGLDAERQKELAALDELIEKYDVLTGKKSASEASGGGSGSGPSARTSGRADLFGLPTGDQMNARRFTLQGEIDAYNAYVEAQAIKRDERLRREWLANKDEPWVVGVVDMDTLDAALQAQDDRISESRDERLRLDRIAAEARLRLEEQVFDSTTQLLNSVAMIGIDAAGRRADEEGDAAKRAFETQKDLNAGLIIANTAAGVMNALKFGAPGVKWLDAAAVGAEGIRQLATNDAAEFGGGSVSAPAPPPTITNTNQSTQTTINITGGVGFGIDELQQLFDDDNILINRDSAQARELRT